MVQLLWRSVWWFLKKVKHRINIWSRNVIPKYSQPSISVGSTSTDSAKSDYKHLGKKFQKVPKNPKLGFATGQQLFTQHSHCIRYYKSSRDDLKYTSVYPWVICKYYTILYKSLEHPQIFVSMADPGTNPLWLWRNDYIYPKELKTGTQIDTCTPRALQHYSQ